jgi:uncharacterized protein (TIGR03435 family)
MASRRTVQASVAATLIAILPIGAFAQSAADASRFEVASVRPVGAQNRFAGNISGGPGSNDPERITFTGVPMMRLLMSAYGIPLAAGSRLQTFGVFSDQISGPAWIENECYDITAKVPSGATEDQVHHMLQKLLAERFGLKLHHEPREVSGYELVVAKNGPKLKPASEANPPSPASGTPGKPVLDNGYPVVQSVSGTRFFSVDDEGSMRVTGKNQSVSDLIPTIITSLNDGKRVVDKTGLTGKYDFKMNLAIDGGFRRPGLPPLTPDDPVGPDIFSALDKYLGLKLQKAQMPIDVLVIDHLDKAPTEN